MAATLLLGIGGGWVFSLLGTPLPWMLGSMTVCALASIFGAQLVMPGKVRIYVLPLIGILLGTNFGPSVLGQIPGFLPTIAAMFVVMLIGAGMSVVYYIKVTGMDRPTGFFCGMPGGLMDMATLGEEAGGDVRTIALVHAARIATIVAVVPFIVQFAEHVSLGARQATPVTILDAPLSTYGWMVAVGVGGVVLGGLIRMPNRFMFGPLLLSAIAHATSATDFVMPREVVNAAQIILGSATGCRFAGFSRRQVVTTLGHAFVANGAFIAITCVAAALLVPMNNAGFSSLLLAFAAGGLSEMSLVALALHLDIVFVVVHQLVRIAVVIVAAPLVFRWWARRQPG